MFRLVRRFGKVRNPADEVVSWRNFNPVRPLASSSAQDCTVKSTIPDMEFPTGNFVPWVLRHGSKWPNRPIFECSVTDRRVTFSQLQDQIARWGGFLLNNLKLSRGDVVTIISQNCIEYAAVMLGTAAVGLVLSTCNNNFVANEIVSHLVEANPKVVVCCPTIESTVNEAVKTFGKRVTVITVGPSSSGLGADLQKILNDESIPFADPVELTGTETMIIPFSSGTTGKPKGVELSHFGFISNSAMLTHPQCMLDAATDEQESLMGILPKFHLYGLMLICASVLQGYRNVVVPKFDHDTYIDTIVKYKISRLYLVPPLLNFLINSKDCNPKTMGHVHAAMCGAAPVLLSAVETFKEKIQRPLFFQEGYGMTEVMITNCTPVGSTRIGSTGQLIPNVQAKVVDVKTGEALPANQNGEICIKSPSVMKGYINNPKATAEMFDSDGWAHTGDVGHYDEDGYFKIVDRTKELIKVKGLQVSPSELEDIILQHPDVEDVGVVGVPHDRLGEAPRAYVVRKGTPKETDIQDFLNSKVSKHKYLVGGVVFIDSIPKTATGKILRKDLKALAMD